MCEVRTAVVTGSSAGIGAGIVAAMRAAGWRVVGVDVQPFDGDESDGPDDFFLADLGKSEEVEELCASLRAKYDRLEAVVNNAAVHWPPATFERTAPADYDRIMAVNVRAPFFLSQGLLPLLKAAPRGHASITMVSSRNAVRAPRNAAAYTASKGALNALVRSMAAELGPDYGIRVNAVMPGGTDTPLLWRHTAEMVTGVDRPRGEHDEATRRKVDRFMHTAFGAETALGRLGTPADVGKAVLWLSDGDAAAFVTGQCIGVDGGSGVVQMGAASVPGGD